MEWERYQNQLAEAERQFRGDEVLGPLVERFGPCKIEPDPDRGPFEALVRSVVYQQLHGKAAETIYQRLLKQLTPATCPEPAAILVLPDTALREAGLSRQKIAAIRDIAERTVSGEIPLLRNDVVQWDDETIIKHLSQARGVGRWTVEMFLIFTLGRLDVWPVDDYGVRMGYRKTIGAQELPKPKELKVIGERWAPWRSVAAWYFWQVANER